VSYEVKPNYVYPVQDWYTLIEQSPLYIENSFRAILKSGTQVKSHPIESSARLKMIQYPG